MIVRIPAAHTITAGSAMYKLSSTTHNGKKRVWQKTSAAGAANRGFNPSGYARTGLGPILD